MGRQLFLQYPLSRGSTPLAGPLFRRRLSSYSRVPLLLPQCRNSSSQKPTTRPMIPLPLSHSSPFLGINGEPWGAMGTKSPSLFVDYQHLNLKNPQMGRNFTPPHFSRPFNSESRPRHPSTTMARPRRQAPTRRPLSPETLANCPTIPIFRAPLWTFSLSFSR